MNKVAKNASWIIACKIVQSLLALVINMLTARYLGPSNYGLITYASSLVAFVVPILQLGFNETIVQELLANPEEEGKVMGTAILLSLLSASACYIGIISFSLTVNANEVETQVVCMLYSLLLFFQSVGLIQYWFQAKLLSKYTSIVSLCSYFIVSAYKTFLLVSHKSIYWFAISNTIDYILISFISLFLFFRISHHSLSFSLSLGNRMLQRSKHYIISGLMVTLFAQTDKIMIKLMIDDTATGFYGATVAITGITGFVFSAIIDSFRPVVLEGKNNNHFEYEERIKMCYSVIVYLSIIQCLLFTVFAWYFLRVLYGVDYTPAADTLRIVSWYTVFSYIGAVRNIWILAEEKQKYLWIINLSGAIINVILNFMLIPVLGINGAALASLITQFFANVVVTFALRPISHANVLLLQALNPRYLMKVSKQMKR